MTGDLDIDTSAPRPALLEISNLAVGFQLHGGLVEAVRGLSLCLRPGSTLALVGESGSGKSVTAQAIMGLLPDNARVLGGRILFNDGRAPARDLLQLAPNGAAMRALRGSRISMIFQEPMVSLSPLHTVGGQISEALHLHRDASRSEGQRLTCEMLARVGFPDPQRALRTYPFELSGGLRQRAMIAMALVCRPSLLIADEPTTALDVTIQAQILQLVRELQAELGMAMLLITHDLGVVANMADDMVVMYHGEVMESGPVQALFETPRHPYLQALARAVPRFAMGPQERLQPVREIRHETGPMLAARDAWPDRARHQPHLRLRGISKQFRIRNQGWFGGAESHVQAVADVSLDIQPGECFGLVGESGCGKTTLSKIIMRALDADSGELIYSDRGRPLDLSALRGRELERFRPKMQFIFQDPFSSLNPRMSVFDIIREPLLIHRVGDAASQAEMAKELMRLVGLDPRFLNRYPHSFSGGQRQRIGIARALALRPDLLICDEPVSALDVSIQAQVLNLLRDLQQELGLTLLFISHNLAVVDYLAARIAVMCRGRIVETAARRDLFSAPQHPYTRALLAAVPHPDLARRLDFEHLQATRASDPAAWPAEFRLLGDEAGRMHQVAPGHWVRLGTTGLAA